MLKPQWNGSPKVYEKSSSISTTLERKKKGGYEFLNFAEDSVDKYNKEEFYDAIY